MIFLKAYLLFGALWTIVSAIAEWGDLKLIWNRTPAFGKVMFLMLPICGVFAWPVTMGYNLSAKGRIL